MKRRTSEELLPPSLLRSKTHASLASNSTDVVSDIHVNDSLSSLQSSTSSFHDSELPNDDVDLDPFAYARQLEATESRLLESPSRHAKQPPTASRSDQTDSVISQNDDAISPQPQEEIYSTQSAFEFEPDIPRGGTPRDILQTKALGGGELLSDSINSFTSEDGSRIIGSDFNSGSHMEGSYLDGFDVWSPAGDPVQINESHPSFLEEQHNAESNQLLPSTHASGTKTSDLHFELASSIVPSVYAQSLSLHVNPRPDQAPKSKPIPLQTNGLALDALKHITRSKQSYAAWESLVKANMAKYGNIAKVCDQFEDATVFRIVKAWETFGVIFAWCVVAKERDKALLMAASRTPDLDFSSQDDIIEESFSQPVVLPPYEPSENEERHLFMLSTSCSSLSVSARQKLLSSQCIGIWSPWTEVPVEMDGEYHIAHVITRFMTDTIY
ncbi:uncharacterized protein BYT42DRAFT_294283 [Radiomyces spectabilis]|uniref:uncharacterized protein n=1 Tax=Radiomyces spectabilis TaxID=64574 RepID=UPI00221ECF3A|nr:uncharacterized protein BYT42DRAFT_294283 [Radiomyces spectabilis]KAI8381142.1 hypothetical protein BYT42DRAFT_294283 [Radiomyces spectabilis]